ncbi:SDR family NAD(P)-dependent oxidoreductase [Planococcus shenhongbingii]|uniref:SDR family NAD(P)-dependent oxidoreductase n=1 Tax=Planococcus shenhongbingii TaxID=3058398 RepID=UPI002639B2AD|nr:SDR family NAD(P)-dependent oxidoreductase [Planococcus sp. N016]WKA59100.1 SDR family NAD(P)-dependent oxidoreductase [Planococcus sp. N016]
MGRLEGKIAIITGAGNGQGQYEAELFAKEGAKVVVTDIDYEAAQLTASAIKQENGQAFALQHNIASEENWKSVISKTLEEYGRIDILVNNAGIHAETKMADISLGEWNSMLNVNLTGTFLGIQEVISPMKENGGGSIVNIASIAALRGGSFAHYSAAKGGIRSLGRTAAIEYAEDKIRVNTVFPGLIATDLVKEALENEHTRKNLFDQLPMKRIGEIEDVAYGVLYLASDESGFVTGSELVIDGGTMAGAKLIE